MYLIARLFLYILIDSVNFIIVAGNSWHCGYTQEPISLSIFRYTLSLMIFRWFA